MNDPHSRMIYLDNNSASFLDPRVLEEMIPHLSGHWGNASSLHRFGQKTRAQITAARKKISDYFGVQPDEILFTSGATEALNLLIRGLQSPGHIISSTIEHASVLAPLSQLEKSGCPVTCLAPDPDAQRILASQIAGALRPDTALIAIMGANNETGIVNEWESIAELAASKGIPYLMDGVALLGNAKWKLPEGVSAACFSGHKISGPPGTGFAVVRKSFKWKSWIEGGPQQFRMRGGSENLPGIMGLAKAVELCWEEAEASLERIGKLRDYFEAGLTRQFDRIAIHGKGAPRLCNTSNVSFPGFDAETLLIQLDLEGIAASHGAACATGALEPSHVLLGMGVNPRLARCAVRFSLGRLTAFEEIERTLAVLSRILGGRSGQF